MKINSKMIRAGIAIMLSAIAVPAMAQHYKWVKGSATSNINTGKITKDKSGNIFTSGSLAGDADMDFSDAGDATLYGTGSFIAKYDADGGYLWSYKLGNAADTLVDIKDIQTDDSGNVYIAGLYTGVVDFDLSDAVADTALERGSSSFGEGFYDPCMYIAKYDADGALVWVMNLTGGSYSDLWDMTVKNDKLYITGGITTYTGAVDGLVDVDFNASKLPADTFYLSGTGVAGVNEFELNPFFAVYDLNADLITAKRIYGTPEFKAYSIDADDSDNIYISGGLRGSHDLDPSLAAADTFFVSGTYGVFIASYNNDGLFRWAVPVLSDDNIGSVFPDNAVLLSVSGNNVYISGAFKGTVDFDPGNGAADTANLTTGTGSIGSSYVAHYDTAGNFISANALSATGNGDKIKAIDTDDSGHLYIAGEFNGTADFDFSPLPGDTLNLYSAGSGIAPDIFFAKYRNDTLVYARKIGNAETQELSGLAVDSSTLSIFGRFSGDVVFNPMPPVDLSSRLEVGGTYLAAYRAFPPSSGKELLTYEFSVPPAIGIITAEDSVLVTVPFGTDVTGLVAGFTTSPASGAFISTVAQVSTVTVNDFSDVITYTIMAEDSTTRDYFVKVTVEDELGIGDVEKAEDAFKVWPNPSDGIIYLEQPSAVKLYDLQGKLQIVTGKVTIVRTDRLAPGIYILENESRQKKKIVVR